MDRTAATPEDLPPLELRKLRDLDVARPAGDQRAPYVSSASAVARRGDFIYVIGDDELDLAVFALSVSEPGELRPALAGELSADAGERSRDKPDIEALTSLPPFDGEPYGGLLGLGSGSKRSRDRGFFWSLAADGSLAGEPRTIDLEPLYTTLRRRIDELNIEGAAILGDACWLFQRGNGAEADNLVVELALDDVIGSLTGDLAIDPAELREIRSYELGELDGTGLCFSDATTLDDDTIVFTASAEVSGDDPDAGTIRGSVVGAIEASGEVRRLRTIDRNWKVEGVHATIDTGVVDFVFVCDQDADEPSPLLSATMPLDHGHERPQTTDRQDP